MNKVPEKEKRIRIGITHGDLNSISYEVIIKTFLDPRILELFTPILYGSSKIASYHRKSLNITDFSFNLIKRPELANPKRPNIYNILDQEVKIELGKSTKIAGELALLSLETATKDLHNNLIDVLVTGPINKSNIQSGSFDFPGHTEYLAKKFNTKDYLMLMVSEDLRVGAITGHIPLKDVAPSITAELIIDKVQILNDSLIKDFRIRKPKIAILGLNPHASDESLHGNEEEEIIIPAIKQAFDKNILVYGPYPADGFFGSSKYTKFDGILAMYHDQAMIPFKTMASKSGVNFTAGLPIVRTSPSHGTAFDLAGKDSASPDSFRNALYLACDIYKNRELHKELNIDPLDIKIPENNSENKSA